MIYRKYLKCTIASLVLLVLIICCNGSSATKDEIQVRSQKINFLLENINSDNKETYKCDSLELAFKLTQTIPSDSIKTKLFIKVLDMAVKVGDESMVHKSADEAFHLSKMLNDTTSKASISWSYGNFYKNKSVMDSAYWYYYQAYKHYQSVNERILTGRMLYNMANVQWRQGDYTGSEINTYKSISRLKSMSYTKGLYLCYNHLGVLYMGMGEYDRSLRFHNQALEHLDDLSDGDEAFRKISYNNIGNLYREQKQFDKAIYFYKKSLDDINEKDFLVFARRTDNLSYARFLNGDSTHVLDGLNKAYRIRKANNDKPGKVISMFHLAQYYEKYDSPIDAVRCAESAKHLALEIFDHRNALSIIQFLSKIDVKNSVKHLNDYIKLNEKIQLEERRTRNKFTRINFETEASIAKSKRLSNQNTTLLVVFVSVVTILGMVVFIRNQRVKNIELLLDKEQQDANQEIFRLMIDQQSKLEEARTAERHRISEDLHDGVLGRLFGTRLGFGFLKINSDESTISKFQSYIDEIQDIEMEIRNISHELKNHQQSTERDFVSIMNYFLQTHSETHGYNFSFKNDDYIDWDDVSEEVKVNFYRIIQEATHNFVKYAKSDKIMINFSLVDHKIELIIVDEGVGFDANKSNKGIGIKNMFSRAERLKGKFIINSSPQKGTLLKIVLPV